MTERGTGEMGGTGEKRFVVAMSGGVDSSVAAWMLAREGLSVVGLFMRNGVHVDAAESSKKTARRVGSEVAITSSITSRQNNSATGLA